MYPVDLVPQKFKIIYQLNPMSVIINAYRQTVLGGGPPNYASFIIAFFVSLVVLFLGFSYFKSREKIFADNI